MLSVTLSRRALQAARREETCRRRIAEAPDEWRRMCQALAWLQAEIRAGGGLVDEVVDLAEAMNRRHRA